MKKPFLLADGQWRSAWLVGADWEALHRVSEEFVWSSDEMIDGIGSMVCGANGEFCMPDIFSRIGLKRCERCCEAVGVPQGDGNPFNSDIKEGQ